MIAWIVFDAETGRYLGRVLARSLEDAQKNAAAFWSCAEFRIEEVK